MAEESEKNAKTSKDRSVAYPSVTLSDAVEFTTKLRETLGKGPYSRDDAAKALGHPKLSGPASRKVAALVHYGLLMRSGNAYNQTQLAQDILMPLSEDQKKEAIVKAARSPRLFEKLIQKYSGQALPTMLQNILVREGVSESATNEVVRLFTETIKFAGLFVNGIVSSVPGTGDEEGLPDANVSVSPDSNDIASTNKITKPATILSVDDFVFDFDGGIKLVVPKNRITSEAIADGELKAARVALSDFAEKFMKPDVVNRNSSDSN